jgi:hypothetical protein
VRPVDPPPDVSLPIQHLIASEPALFARSTPFRFPGPTIAGPGPGQATRFDNDSKPAVDVVVDPALASLDRGSATGIERSTVGFD